MRRSSELRSRLVASSGDSLLIRELGLMSTPEKKSLEGAFAPALKVLGFKKRGGTWHRNQGDWIQVINIQGSQWSRTFYINLGVYLPELGMKESPAEYDCHIRERLNQLVPDNARLVQLLDLHSKTFIEVEGSELVSLVVEYGIPWLDRCSDKAGFLEEAQKSGAFVRFEAKAIVAAAMAQQRVSRDGLAAPELSSIDANSLDCRNPCEP